jgi:hypothetical protein
MIIVNHVNKVSEIIESLRSVYIFILWISKDQKQNSFNLGVPSAVAGASTEP